MLFPVTGCPLNKTEPVSGRSLIGPDQYKYACLTTPETLARLMVPLPTLRKPLTAALVQSVLATLWKSESSVAFADGAITNKRLAVTDKINFVIFALHYLVDCIFSSARLGISESLQIRFPFQITT